MSSVVQHLATLVTLSGDWRNRAQEWERFGIEPQAQLLRVLASEVEVILNPILQSTVGLATAHDLTGVSQRTLQRDLVADPRDGVGRKWKPRFVVSDLIDRYVSGDIGRQIVLLRERAA